MLVSVISGLEISWGTPSRDIISPSHNCRGQGRSPNLPIEINYKTSLAALATDWSETSDWQHLRAKTALFPLRMETIKPQVDSV